jgi:hypothetical protein
LKGILGTKFFLDIGKLWLVIWKKNNLVNANMRKIEEYTDIICTLLKSIQSNKEQESGKLNLLGV